MIETLLAMGILHALGDSLTSDTDFTWGFNRSYVNHFSPELDAVNEGIWYSNCIQQWTVRGRFLDIEPGDTVLMMCRQVTEFETDPVQNLLGVLAMRNKTLNAGAEFYYSTHPPWFGTPPPNEDLSRAFYDIVQDTLPPDDFIDLLTIGTEEGWHEDPWFHSDGVHIDQGAVLIAEVLEEWMVPEPSAGWLGVASLLTLLGLRGWHG